MSELGFRWGRSTAAKVELGQRSIDVDELVALAYVLGASPVALLTGTSGRVGIGGSIAVDTKKAWRWMTGAGSMGGRRTDAKTGATRVPESPQVDNRFYLEACPDFVIEAEGRFPGVRNLLMTAALIQAVASGAGGDEEDEARLLIEMRRLLSEAKREVKFLQQRVDPVIEAGDE